MTKLLCKLFPYKQIGWEEIGEDFIRFQLIKTPWFNLYLHRLVAETWHADCHDHPWSFITLILKNGYFEQFDGLVRFWKPGTVLYRPATSKHNVKTALGTGACWSLVLTGPRVREWGFQKCPD